MPLSWHHGRAQQVGIEPADVARHLGDVADGTLVAQQQQRVAELQVQVDAARRLRSLARRQHVGEVGGDEAGAAAALAGHEGEHLALRRRRRGRALARHALHGRLQRRARSPAGGSTSRTPACIARIRNSGDCSCGDDDRLEVRMDMGEHPERVELAGVGAVDDQQRGPAAVDERAAGSLTVRRHGADVEGAAGLANELGDLLGARGAG